jgi:choline dehydrogenase-like flavoprotein
VVALGNKNDVVDVLVIGAGMSGAPFAWSLSKAGIQVMCLEQGNWPVPSEYPVTHDDWELHLYSDYHFDPNVRGLPEDYPVNTDDTPITPFMYNAVGGSAVHWGAHFPRMRPSDFRVRTLDGVADDWPVTYDDLVPFFDLNDTMTGVSGVNGNPAYPPMPPRQTPPLGIGKQGNKLVEGFEKLGWHWWPAESAINSAPYDGRPACTYGGPCVTGCYNKSKSSADVTYWPKAIASGAKLETGARVAEITLGADGLTNGVVYYDAQGVVQQQKARIVVMAANGIGTARLLLNSKSALFPDGLANTSGLLGKNLMFHPVAASIGVFDEDLEAYKGPLACAITSYEHCETDLSRGFVRGYQMQSNRQMGPINTALGGAVESYVPWGDDHHAAFGERFGNIVPITSLGEDLPELHNEVVLDPKLTDSDGIPAPKVNYTMSENSIKMMAHSEARTRELMEAAGATKVFSNSLMKGAGWHLLGTARMGTDPNNSVVNEFGRAHDVKNLFVIDGSLFVTSGAVNPTSTIQALALYIADNLKNSARHLLD